MPNSAIWWPRDATAYSRPDVGGARKLHLSNGEGLSLCGKVTLCDDEPGMGHDDPPRTICCKRCLRISRM